MKTILSLFLLVLLTACEPVVEPIPEPEAPPIEEPEEEGTFEYSDELDYYGTLVLTGYLDVNTHECPPDGMCGETVEYASFIFEKTNDETIYDFLDLNNGNSFTGSQAVGIGCYQEDQNRIYSENFGDDSYVESIISGEDLVALLASSEANPVELELTRPVYTSGRGAPDCYSHFREFDVL